MNILVTGGAGFIGSHVCVKLLDLGHKIIVIDNFINSHYFVLSDVLNISKINKNLIIFDGDIRNKSPLQKIFLRFDINIVIHLAGLKSVTDSFANPANYFSNNVDGSKNLFKLMEKSNCKKIIFSSSATVYGTNQQMPLNESANIYPESPYGLNKQNIEQILTDLFNFDNSWHIAILRFFNPIGAHQSGLIGENPVLNNNNLMSYILRVASGELSKLHIYGDDYETHDGTGVRDYIHVEDIALGHIKALEAIIKKPRLIVTNLGTGTGYSVLDIVRTFEEVTKQKINFDISARRRGDVSVSYSDPTFAKLTLNWEAKLNLEDMCKDAWNFTLNNMR